MTLICNTENRIISRLIMDVLGEEYTISILDDKGYILSRSDNFKDIMAEIGHTEETVLHIYLDIHYVGAVFLIRGDGPDVIADMHCSVAHLAAGAQAIADQF